jgi:hypothetical protein
MNIHVAPARDCHRKAELATAGSTRLREDTAHGRIDPVAL